LKGIVKKGQAMAIMMILIQMVLIGKKLNKKIKDKSREGRVGM